ncbi:hypothetical protein BKA70DRAFT_1421792 [Coprinopsis sp. MPI-PUGE-AT-0042]|nr:hypothetical protein BKA70DRAFT_1421792 [Coprinopsis sp. MPI-PUGE-AT-0042]
MSGQCDRPHVPFEHFEDLTSRAGTLSPCHWTEDLAEMDTNGGAATAISSETRSLMSDSNSSYHLPHSPPNSTLLQLQEDSIMTLDLSLPNSLLFTNDDRITSLERSVCSNFLCCGENLRDFHALVDHFEENHVSAVSSSGKQLYPKQKPKIEIDTSLVPSSSSSSRSSSLSMSPAPSPATTLDSMASTPASSRSSSVVPSPPMPVTPLSPPHQNSPFAGAAAAAAADGVTIVSHDSSPPPIAPHLSASQSSLMLPAIEYNPYIGIIAPLLEVAVAEPMDVQPKPKARSSSSKRAAPFSVEVISAFGQEYDFARDYARYEEAWRRKTQEAEASVAAATLAYDQAQLERELREAEEEEMERMGFSLSMYETGDDVQGLGLEGMQVDSTKPSGSRSNVSYSPSASYPSASSSSTTTTRSLSQPPATNNGGKVPKTARPRPRVNTFLAPSSSSSSCPTSSSSSSSSSTPPSSTNPSRPKVTIPTIPNAPPVSLGKKREKAYKCPNWGCMKAYLNPNGLKYHLEKGTCKFDEGALRGGFLRSSAASAGTSSSNPTTTVVGASPVSPVVASTTPTAPTTVLAVPQDQVMEVEEDEEEEQVASLNSSLVTRPPLQAVSSNGSCYPAVDSQAAGKPWMAPCAV